MFSLFTGLDVSEFDSLRWRIELARVEHEKKRLSRPERNERGRRRPPFKLSLEDRLLMLLILYG